MKKGNWKKIMSILAATMGTTFVITSLVAKIEKGKSQYKDESNQMNPLEGKKVVFIENDDEIENADGVRGHLEAIGDSDYKVSFYEKYIKRGFDIVLSFGGLVVLSPILGAIALAIKIDDPGPVLFTQKRMGQNKRYFKLHKFRSMKMCTPHDVPTHQLENPEQYITRVGKFLRSHSLDELPQIWDIFIGNMSVIGPRPGLWNQDILTAERDKYNANNVKPGLTGYIMTWGIDHIPQLAQYRIYNMMSDYRGTGLVQILFFIPLLYFLYLINRNSNSINLKNLSIVFILTAFLFSMIGYKIEVFSRINKSFLMIYAYLIPSFFFERKNNNYQSIRGVTTSFLFNYRSDLIFWVIYICIRGIDIPNHSSYHLFLKDMVLHPQRNM